MLLFLVKRLVTMLVTAICLTIVVFALTNLPPNLEKIAKSEIGTRISDAEVTSWLDKNGFGAPLLVRYGEWLGLLPGWTRTDENGVVYGRCIREGEDPATAPIRCGVLQGEWGYSRVFRQEVADVIARGLGLTGKLMFWVLLVMVPGALLTGVLAGMREGSRTDRALSTASIVATATPEYVSGVVFIAVFTSSAVGLKWFNGSATSAMDDATLVNFTLPVLTVALYAMGYVARMTRASMAEVMTAQYIRTARLKGVSFPKIVLRHALRNALIAPFTVIMLQIPWLLNGVVIVETLFNYKGFGWTLVQAAGNNDIDLLLGVSVVSVIVVLLTQLISDVGYVFLNPRIRLA
ncbi:ABC transporter permease [Rubellimicrobium arenae]|uniref:ABC transporter permease n=1 Tax=Rubellimicrobium arenae TaxID=2817372 RepID=UPI001B3115D7|nr:ABC transporter permease [Rubellimicrobium arenae]